MAIVVVTGATGLLGANVVRALISHNYRVRGTCRDMARARLLAGSDVEWLVADLACKDALGEAFREASAVIHCAGDTAQSRWLTPSLRAANILGTENVIRASAEAGVERMVHCSSTTTCGVSKSERPANERSLERDESRLFPDGYTQSKYQAETLARDAARHLDVVIANPGYLLGPLDAKPTSGRFILRLAEGKARGWPTGWNSFVDVRDVAEGIVQVLDKGWRGENYILAGENLPYRTIMQMAAQRLGVSPPRLPIPSPIAWLAGYAGDAMERITGRSGDINSATVRYGFAPTFRMSSDKAERELGYTTRPISQAIDAAVEWFSENGMLPRTHERVEPEGRCLP